MLWIYQLLTGHRCRYFKIHLVTPKLSSHVSEKKHLYTRNKLNTYNRRLTWTGSLITPVTYPGTKAPQGVGELINLGHDNFVPPTAPPDSRNIFHMLNLHVLNFLLIYC